MKRILLYALLLLALAGCSKPHLYITYDTVQVHQEPSEQSGVLATISCAPKPAGYRETPRSKILYWTGINNAPWPLAVIKTDKSKQWGYISILFLEARKNVRGWILLEGLLDCGTGEAKEPQYTVNQDKVMLYKHPRAAAAEQTKIWLHGGEAVQVLSKEEGWVHVTSGQAFGWVQLSQLEPIAEADKKAGYIWIIIAGCVLALAVSIFIVLRFRKKKICSETTSSQ